MNTLSNERIEEIAALEIKTTDAGTQCAPQAHSKIYSHEMVTMARELLALRKEREAAVPIDVSGPLEHAYKELTPHFMRQHIDIFERYGIAPNDTLTVIQALWIALDEIERRVAQPAQPVTVPDDLYKIANHIASAKGGLPDEWQGWAEEIETDIRRAAMLKEAK